MQLGTITCNCGQLFGYETTKNTVKCPKCMTAHETVMDQTSEDLPEEFSV